MPPSEQLHVVGVHLLHSGQRKSIVPKFAGVINSGFSAFKVVVLTLTTALTPKRLSQSKDKLPSYLERSHDMEMA